MHEYGRQLGLRYKDRPNVIYFVAGEFYKIRQRYDGKPLSADEEHWFNQFGNGICSVDASHLISIHGFPDKGVVAQLTREEMNAYLAKRKAQEFNTILMVMLPWSDEADGTVNVYGDQPFYLNQGQCDLARPKTTPGEAPDDAAAYDYWDHVDFFVRRAADEGFFLACLPCWGGGWVHAKRNAFTESSAYAYGQWLGRRYHNARNIIWVLGGDVRPGDRQPVYRAMAEGLADGTNGVNQLDGAADYATTLMTYHEPKVWGDNADEFGTSATWFHADAWLDLNSCQEHPEKAARAILHDFHRRPTKPAWLFEGRYEAYRRDPKTPAWDAWSVRYQAYQSVFSGGFGHVYGHEGVFSFGRPTPGDLPGPDRDQSRGLRRQRFRGRGIGATFSPGHPLRGQLVLGSSTGCTLAVARRTGDARAPASHVADSRSRPLPPAALRESPSSSQWRCRGRGVAGPTPDRTS